MMDEFDESVESPEESAGSKFALIALLVGIVGIVVGATGIIMANQAQKAVKTVRAEMAAEPDRTPELEGKIEDMNARLEKLGGEFVKLGRQDRQIQENTQAAFNSVTSDVKANREGINEVTQKMSELVEKLENWKPTTSVARRSTATPTASGDADETAEPAEAAEGGIYTVQSGDTLSAIANRFGISLSQLQAANPTVNPRAMRIGQKIVIPE